MPHKTEQKPLEQARAKAPRRERSALESPAKHDVDPDQRAFLAGKNGLKHEELADELGESFVESATSGEPVEPERHDRITDQDRGGPFVASTARKEFARDVDAANPEDAEAEPFPTANRVGDPRHH